MHDTDPPWVYNSRYDLLPRPNSTTLSAVHGPPHSMAFVLIITLGLVHPKNEALTTHTSPGTWNKLKGRFHLDPVEKPATKSAAKPKPQRKKLNRVLRQDFGQPARLSLAVRHSPVLVQRPLEGSRTPSPIRSRSTTPDHVSVMAHSGEPQAIPGRLHTLHVVLDTTPGFG